MILHTIEVYALLKKSGSSHWWYSALYCCITLLYEPIAEKWECVTAKQAVLTYTSVYREQYRNTFTGVWYWY